MGQSDPGTERTDSQTFIVSVWLAEPVQDGRETTWRGHITHMPSGERRHFNELQAMVLFVASYLERMGARMGAGWRLKQRLLRALLD